MNTDTPSTDMQQQIIRDLERKVQGWQATAASAQRSMETYHGWLTEIGRLLGPDAYLADDGSYQQDILVAKVPELVRQMAQEARGFQIAGTHLWLNLCRLQGEPVTWVSPDQGVAAVIGHMNQQARDSEMNVQINARLSKEIENLTASTRQLEEAVEHHSTEGAQAMFELFQPGKDSPAIRLVEAAKERMKELSDAKAKLGDANIECRKLEGQMKQVMVERDREIFMLKATLQTSQEEKARLEQKIVRLAQANDKLFTKTAMLRNIPGPSTLDTPEPVDLDEAGLHKAVGASATSIGKPKPGVEFLPGGLVGPLTVASDTPPEPALDWSKNFAELLDIDKP